jgi:hypothetical protein
VDKYRYRPFSPVRRIADDRDAAEQSSPLATGGSQAFENLTHGTYGSLLFDSRWKKKRAEILQRDDNCCVICKSTNELLVHHRQYQFMQLAKGFKMPWDYANHLLITLCKGCHNRGHSKFKVPILIIQ